MTEQSTVENEKIVSAIYMHAIGALQDGKAITPDQRLVHDVEHLMQEVNSGASFEQYFRWCSIDELGAIASHLDKLGLDVVAGLTREAIAIAFPDGLPSTEEEQSEMTAWTEAQEAALSALYEALEDENGHVMNVLGEFAARVGAMPVQDPSSRS